MVHELGSLTALAGGHQRVGAAPFLGRNCVIHTQFVQQPDRLAGRRAAHIGGRAANEEGRFRRSIQSGFILQPVEAVCLTLGIRVALLVGIHGDLFEAGRGQATRSHVLAHFLVNAAQIDELKTMLAARAAQGAAEDAFGYFLVVLELTFQDCPGGSHPAAPDIGLETAILIGRTQRIVLTYPADVETESAAQTLVGQIAGLLELEAGRFNPFGNLAEGRIPGQHQDTRIEDVIRIQAVLQSLHKLEGSAQLGHDRRCR